MDFENQYATPYATMVLYKLLKFVKETAVQKARDSTQPDTIRVLDVNDISLPWGGEFDIYADWSTPHRAHRTGRTVDIPYRVIRVTPDWSFVQHLEGQKGVIKKWLKEFLKRECRGCFDIKEEDDTNHFHLWIDRGRAMLGYEDLYPVYR